MVVADPMPAVNKVEEASVDDSVDSAVTVGVPVLDSVSTSQRGKCGCC